MTSSMPTRDPATKNQKTKVEVVTHYGPPLKPRRALVWIISGVIVLWITGLLVMYFLTVYPERHGPNAKPRFGRRTIRIAVNGSSGRIGGSNRAAIIDEVDDQPENQLADHGPQSQQNSQEHQERFERSLVAMKVRENVRRQ